MIIVQEADFDSAALLARLREQVGAEAGAIVTFTGYVRDFAPGQATETLYLEHYPGMCERELHDIAATAQQRWNLRSEEHTSELQSLMRTSYAVFCLKKKKHTNHKTQ